VPAVIPKLRFQTTSYDERHGSSGTLYIGEVMTLSELDNIFSQLYEFKDVSSDAENQVVAATYNTCLVEANTFIQGASGLPNTRPDKYEYIIHAEANLVYTAAREGHPLKDDIVLCTLSPCQNCIRIMFQAGIREIYYKDTYRVHNIEMRDIKVTETKHGQYTRMLLENYVPT